MRIRICVGTGEQLTGWADMEVPDGVVDKMPFELFARMYLEPAFVEAYKQAVTAEASAPGDARELATGVPTGPSTR